MSNKRPWKVLLAIAGILILCVIPGMIPLAAIFGVAISRQWKRQGRGSFVDWLSEQAGVNVGRNPQRQNDDPFRELRERAPVPQQQKKTKAAKVKGRTPLPAEPQERGDAYWYSYMDEKFQSQPYIGSTGKDPWDLPPGIDAWDLPAEHPPWEI
ncbi:MAG TPA: hypothetical protein GX499_01760 [Clostridiales bacterium]|nr:hypothetical protein [Clostridiales bacterium]